MLFGHIAKRMSESSSLPVRHVDERDRGLPAEACGFSRALSRFVPLSGLCASKEGVRGMLIMSTEMIRLAEKLAAHGMNLARAPDEKCSFVMRAKQG